MSDTTIRVKKTTKAKLSKLGSAGDSLNDIIEMLLQNYEESINNENYK